MRRHPRRVPTAHVSDDGTPLIPGALFAGRYRMVPSLGRGGIGEVWHADDLVLDTPVALKVIDLTIAESRARILKEVRLARQITHPAVCRVFDVGETDDRVFYSMELVRGRGSRRRCCGTPAVCRPRKWSTSAGSCAPASRPRTRRACCIATSSRPTS